MVPVNYSRLFPDKYGFNHVFDGIETGGKETIDSRDWLRSYKQHTTFDPTVSVSRWWSRGWLVLQASGVVVDSFWSRLLCFHPHHDRQLVEGAVEEDSPWGKRCMVQEYLPIEEELHLSFFIVLITCLSLDQMEELRAHATDWTQNIQNMSMDFRIPNPLEFNDPFLLQRRRWKRSERRRMRRGAEGTLGYWAQAGSQNGYLPNRWGGLSSSMSQLEAHSSIERAVVAKSRARLSAVGGGTVPRAGPGLRVEPAVGLHVERRSFPHLLARSFSVPVAHSTSKLNAAAAAMQGESLSGSESPYDSRSDGSSVSLSFLALHQFQPCCTISTMEKGGQRAADMDAVQEKHKLLPAEKWGSVVNSTYKQTHTPAFRPHSSPPPPFLPHSPPPIILPSPPLNTASSASCQLLDFFGENLAYIDESSDTLSDRTQPGASEAKKKRPRKPKRKSMRRQLPHRWSPLQVRKPNSDMQPPSNPPTPPPDSSLSDLPSSKQQTDSAPALWRPPQPQHDMTTHKHSNNNWHSTLQHANHIHVSLHKSAGNHCYLCLTSQSQPMNFALLLCDVTELNGYLLRTEISTTDELWLFSSTEKLRVFPPKNNLKGQIGLFEWGIYIPQDFKIDHTCRK